MQFPNRSRVAPVEPWRNLADSSGVHLDSLAERMALAGCRLTSAPVTRSRPPACAPLRPPACPHSRSAHASVRPVQKGSPAAQADPPRTPCAPCPETALPCLLTRFSALARVCARLAFRRAHEPKERPSCPRCLSRLLLVLVPGRMHGRTLATAKGRGLAAAPCLSFCRVSLSAGG